jgi:hypothetical protein
MFAEAYTGRILVPARSGTPPNSMSAAAVRQVPSIGAM